MANVKPQFEQVDQSGSTVCYNGTVGATEISLPSVADKVITSFVVILPDDGTYDTSTEALKVSPDNSSCWVTVCPKGHFSAKVRGTQKQIKINASPGFLEKNPLIQNHSPKQKINPAYLIALRLA